MTAYWRRSATASTDRPSWPATCVSALRERSWDGDHELAEALDAALGSGPTPMLRPLPVDLEELSMILEGDPVQGGGRIDLGTGEVWPQSAIEYAEEVGEMTRRMTTPIGGCGWTARGRGAATDDMVWFIEELDDPNLRRPAGPRDLRARCLPPVQGRPLRSARPDDAVVRVLQTTANADEPAVGWRPRATRRPRRKLELGLD